MAAVDPRLFGFTQAARRYLALSVAIGVVTAALVIVQAWLLAGLITAAFQEGADLTELRTPMAALLGVVVARALLSWAAEAAAHRSSARAKSELRRALLRRAVDFGPSWLAGRRTADLTTLSTRGVDALDAYFAKYLPQLVLAVIVPTAVVAVVVVQDWLAAAIIAVTVPLIPLFMVVVGVTTRARTARRLSTLQRLSGHFLDAVAGLPTLKVFGRAKSYAVAIRQVTDSYRRETMSTLRIAFLSSLVLELVASLSVAVVAVAIGLRLVGGDLDLFTGLFVLVLAPEAYLPLRLLGANFHASADGLAAADQVFSVLEEPLPPRGVRTDVPDPAAAGLEVTDIEVIYPDREEPAISGLCLSLNPGETVALTGPSGCGKSTLLAVLLGFVTLRAGRVQVGDVDLADLDPDAWRARVAWVPQRPHLFAATLAENIRLGHPDVSDESVCQAVDAAGLTDLVDRLPLGLATSIGERGAGLAVGERQRVALARAFLRDAPLLLLDEPTANLDGATEAAVLNSVRRIAAGRTVLIAAHRPALVAVADREVRLNPSPAEVRA